MPPSLYAGHCATLVTRHAKERVLAPVLRHAADLHLEVCHGIDTDRLGTFTRDVPRVGSQRDAARDKARLGVEHAGTSLGIGSEGSFVPGPLGLSSWNVEIVLLLDLERGIEIVGRAQGPGLHIHGLAGDRDALSALASAARFPEHALVLRPDGPAGAEPVKGLADWEALLATFERLRQEAVTGLVFVESDLRAHCHPTRMQMIERAGHDLAERLITCCPSCGSPGFGHSEVVRGLPCADCGTPTDMASGDRHTCVRCAYTEDRARLGATVGDPARCPVCNP